MSMPLSPSTKNLGPKGPRARARLAAVAGAATFAVLAFAGPASAQSAPTDNTGTRAELACSRIPNITIRTENVLARINGSAETRGSLLWLDTKIDQARERDREDIAVVLENRREVREALIPILENRLIQLSELSIRGEEAGYGQ
ncbi:MAG: hypothetical protein O3C27_13640 [Actinomycetota bacterium]|nr:hypothetical protein [Actinomycetota bacterium]